MFAKNHEDFIVIFFVEVHDKIRFNLMKSLKVSILKYSPSDSKSISYKPFVQYCFD